MGFRFRRSVKLAPGVRINFGKSGTSLSLGGRGSRVTYGPRGTTTGFGVPGTGMSFVQHHPKTPPANRRTRHSSIVQTSMKLALHDDGRVEFEMPDGTPATPALVRKMREQNADLVQAWLEDAVAEFNAEYEQCVNLHTGTPNPHKARFQPLPAFDDPTPVAPTQKECSWLDKLLGRKGQIEKQNHDAMEQFLANTANWQGDKDKHEKEAAQWSSLLNGAASGDEQAMETLFGHALGEIIWPRETTATFQLDDGATALCADIDLPDEDDLPRRIASLPARGISVRFKERTDAQMRKDFNRLAHATLFRVVGEAFATLPALRTVTASGFVQRTNPATAKIDDVYIISCRVERSQWDEIDFEQLNEIDPVSALARFKLVKLSERNGRLKAIQPLR